MIPAEGKVLVDFYADWCGPCRRLGPIIENVAQKIGDKANVYKVNIDEGTGLARRFNIRGVPTMVIFKNGKVVGTMSGVQTEAVILNAIENAL
mgnify:CR=1 FL=1